MGGSPLLWPSPLTPFLMATPLFSRALLVALLAGPLPLTGCQSDSDTDVDDAATGSETMDPGMSGTGTTIDTTSMTDPMGGTTGGSGTMDGTGTMGGTGTGTGGTGTMDTMGTGGTGTGGTGTGTGTGGTGGGPPGQ